MKYKDFLVKLNELVKISDLLPSEALAQLRDIEAPKEFQPLLIALREYFELKQCNLMVFLKHLPEDLKD